MNREVQLSPEMRKCTRDKPRYEYILGPHCRSVCFPMESIETPKLDTELQVQGALLGEHRYVAWFVQKDSIPDEEALKATYVAHKNRDLPGSNKLERGQC